MLDIEIYIRILASKRNPDYVMRKAIASICFFFSVIGAMAQWDTVHFIGGTQILNHIDFYNDSSGFAVGSDYYTYITHDQGETWETFWGVGDHVDFEFRANGDAIVMDWYGGFDRYNIFTYDYEPLFPPFAVEEMSVMEMINDSIALAGGYEGIYRIDFGHGIDTVWSFPSVGFSFPFINSLFRISDTTIYAYGIDGLMGIIIRSSDNGSTWDTINENTGLYGSLHYHSEDILFLASDDGIYKSINGGVDWSKTNCYPDTSFLNFRDITFTDENNGYVVGGGTEYPEIKPTNIYKTTDGGDNWYYQYFAQHGGLYSVCFLMDSIGFTCGESLAILKTINGGGIGVGLSNLHENNVNISSYPNPFTTSTTIEYELKEISNIQFTIYNVIGEVVYQAEDRIMPQGKHSFIWTADRLPEGLYYAVLRSEERVVVVKAIKQ